MRLTNPPRTESSVQPRVGRSPETIKVESVLVATRSFGLRSSVRDAVVQNWYTIGIALSLLSGLLVRLLVVFRGDFPLNDGGLFYLMSQEIEANHFQLPVYTTYNGDHIPFAYPPLGFYLTGMLQAASGASLIEIYRFFPLAVNLVTIVAFFTLVRTLVPNRRTQIYALFAFVLLPRSFEWLIMGGGVTRSLGALFVVLGFHQAYLLYARRERKRLPLAILFTGSTVLSHLEWAWFLAFSIGLLVAVYGRNRDGILHSVILASGAALVTAPWWLIIVLRFGVAPFLSASHTDVSALVGTLLLVTGHFTDEPYLPLIAYFALCGAYIQVRHKQYFYVVWLLMTFLFDARSAPTTSLVPVAILAAVGLDEIILPVAAGTFQRARTCAELPRRSLRRRVTPPIIVAASLLYAVWAASTAWPTILAPLSPESRAAMGWFAEHTPSDSRALVVTSIIWEEDATSEWFPVLADRRSVATVQGTEWLGEEFRQRSLASQALAECATKDAACLNQWAMTWDSPFDYVFIPKYVIPPRAPLLGHTRSTSDPFANLRTSLTHAPGYFLVYDGPGGTVYRTSRTTTTAPTPSAPRPGQVPPVNRSGHPVLPVG